MSNLLTRIWSAMEWGEEYQLSPRDRKIMNHYDRKVAQGMSENIAFERAYSDLQGNSGQFYTTTTIARNGLTKIVDKTGSKPQRAKPKLAVTVSVIKADRS